MKLENQIEEIELAPEVEHQASGYSAGTKVECIAISGVPSSISVGDSFTLTTDVYPVDASNKVIRWSSEDPYIASVDSNTGKVNAHLACSVYIVASATDGSGVFAKRKINIKQASTKPVENPVPPDGTNPTPGSMVADSVEAFSGSHCISNSLIKFFGGQKISLDIHYKSSTLVKGMFGIGWNHNYEKKLEIIDSSNIRVYSTPSSFATFKKLLSSSYKCDIPGKTGYSLTVNNLSTFKYCLNCNFDSYEYYDSTGRLRKVTDRHGFETLINYNGNIVTVIDTVTGAEIHLEKDNNSLVTRVYDGIGREVNLEYTNNCLTCIEDVRGNSLTYTYDSEGKILTGTDSNNITYFSNVYDSLDRIITQNDAICSTPTEFEYNCYDTRVVTNRNGDKSIRKFDENGLLIEHTDENGNTKKYEYDSNYNISKEIDGLGNFSLTVYNDYNKPVEMTDKNGNKTTITYDANCNVIKIEHPVSNGATAEETFTYNSRNQVLTYTNMKGIVTVFTYYSDGLLKSKKVGSRNAIQYTYENGLLKSVTDAMNYTTTFVYNAYGMMVSKTDAQNRTYAYEYDNCGNLLKTTDPNGKTIENVYDCNNQKISVKDANGNITQYRYNGNMKNTEIVIPDGNTIEYEYDNEDRLVKVIDQVGNETTTQYDKAGRVISKTESDNSIVSYEYDAADRVIKEINPKGAITLKTYDAVGNLLTLTDDNGNVTRYEYNSMSKMVKKTDAMLNVTEYLYAPWGDLYTEVPPIGISIMYDYDEFGNKTEIIDPRGNKTRYTYDANNNLLTVTDALNNVTTYTYNSLNQLVSVKDAKNHTVTYGYDALGRRTTVTDARGNTFTTQYDANGNVLKVLDAKSKTVTESVYNCLNLPSSVTDATGKTVTYTYNALGKVSVAVDSMNNRNEFTYNSRGQNTQVKDTYNGLSNATYDALGNVTSLSGPTGAITTYAFDKIGRLVSKTTTSGHTETYGYNALNLKTSLTNGRGQSRTYTYDALGRVLTCVDADDSMSFTYDDNGNVLTATNKNGTVTRTFDALNRVSSYTDTFGKTVGYVYDAVGNLVRLTYPDNTSVVYEYDANNNLIKVTDWANRVTTYTYDVNNKVIGVVKPDGTTTTTQYDDKQRITYTAERTTSGAIISGFEFTYDTLGRIVEEKHLAKNIKMCYTYDNLSRVTTRTIVNLSDNSQTQETFTYDAAGNITGGSAGTTFAYGTNNRLTSFNGQTVSYDADGNMLSCGSKSFTYDVGNKLITADGHTYFYNAEGVRIRNLCSSEDTTYTYNTNAKLSMLLMKITGGVVTKYVYGRGLIGEETSSTFKTYHFDYRGSTVAITNISGSITDTFDYDTYGKLISRTGSSTVIFGYNGRDGVVTDSNGLIYMRARYYSPDLRRFINADIVAGEISNAITLNRYAYANGNPAINVDPLGLWGLKSDWNNFTNRVVDTYDSVKNSIVKTYNNVKDSIVDTYNDVKDSVVDTYNDVKDWVDEKIVQPVYEFISDIEKDIENYDKNNVDEGKVLESNYFSSYKGKFVIKANLDRSFSLGVLFIDSKMTNNEDGINTVKHEYGHTKQLDQMGIVDYLVFIGLPSWQKWGDESYYRKPWEITADVFGGVDLNSRRNDDPLTQEHIDEGDKYLEIASSNMCFLKKIKQLKKYY